MYNGIEVDMLGVGDADCLLVSRWNGFVPTRILIDGGNAGDFGTLRAFLKRRDISYLDAIVCTHLHNDHAAGLVQLAKDQSVRIGVAYVHVPQNHLRMALVEKALKTAAGASQAACVEKTLKTADDLLAALWTRKIRVVEPFQGAIIEFLTVVGPSLAYYEELIHQFEDADAIRSMGQGNLNSIIEDALDDFLAKMGVIEGSLLDNPQTSAENNSSVIMGTVFNGKKYLFTSDAGAPALKLGTAAYDLARCYWMQLPHHGSRHNITAELIEHFSPTFAYVSATGNLDHPRRSVVNAFKKVGAQVFSTHYPDLTNLWHQYGTVPTRTDYSAATPLYDKDSKVIGYDPSSIASLSRLYGTAR